MESDLSLKVSKAIMVDLRCVVLVFQNLSIILVKGNVYLVILMRDRALPHTVDGEGQILLLPTPCKLKLV